jgi:hypothetical protein
MADKPSIQLLVLTGTAPGSVTAHRLVGFDDAQASVAGQKIKGVARSGAASGELYPIGAKGTDVVETGGAFAAGDDLVSDASGKAVKASALSAVVTAISSAANAVVTAAAHGFKTGDVIALTSVEGAVEANGLTFQITVSDADTFTLNAASSGWTAFSGTAVATRVAAAESLFARALEASSGSGKFVEVLLT